MADMNEKESQPQPEKKEVAIVYGRDGRVMNPKSLAQLSQNKPGNPHGFKQGNSGFTGKHHPRTLLREAYQDLLSATVTDLKTGKRKKISRQLAQMHYVMLRRTYKKRNAAMFSRLLTDFAIAAGEASKNEPAQPQISAQNVILLPSHDSVIQLPPPEQAEYEVQSTAVSSGNAPSLNEQSRTLPEPLPKTENATTGKIQH